MKKTNDMMSQIIARKKKNNDNDMMTQIVARKKKSLESFLDMTSPPMPEFLKQNEGRLTRDKNEVRLEMLGGDDSE